MKKRMMGILLALSLCLTLLPIGVGAAESATGTADFTVGGGTAAISLLNQHKTVGADDSTWNSSNNTLILKGIDFTTTAATAVKLPAGSTIVLADGSTNTIKSGDVTINVSGGYNSNTFINALDAAGNLTIQGSTGALEIIAGTVNNGGNGWTYSSGIAVNGDFTVTGGHITAQGGTVESHDSCFSIGVNMGNGSLTVTGGTLTAIAGKAYELQADGTKRAVFSRGVYMYRGNVSVSGNGKLTAQSVPEMADATSMSNGLYVSAGNLSIADNGEVSVSGSYGTYISGGSIYLSGGKLTAASTRSADTYDSYAIDVEVNKNSGAANNGNITVNGGTLGTTNGMIYMYTSGAAENQGLFTVTDGSIVNNGRLYGPKKLDISGGTMQTQQIDATELTLSGGTLTVREPVRKNSYNNKLWANPAVDVSDLTISGGRLDAAWDWGAFTPIAFPVNDYYGYATSLVEMPRDFHTATFNGGTTILNTGCAGNNALLIKGQLTKAPGVEETGANMGSVGEHKQEYSDTPVVFSNVHRTDVTVSDVKAQNKEYDGTKAATLTAGTVSPVTAGDTVSLGSANVKAEFKSKDVGNNIAVTVKSGIFDLRGKDAYKYNLTTQPTGLSGLKANITYTVADDTTLHAQTIRVGEGNSFRHPSFTGVGGETVTDMVDPTSYTYKINADTLVHNISAGAIPDLLNHLSANDTAHIRYTLVKSGNYEPPHTANIITVTMQARSGSTSSGSSSYTVYVAESSNGTVTASPKNASKGDTVTITVKPDSGYTLETLTVTDSKGNELALTDKGNGKYTFTMPASRVDVKATFMEDNSLLNFFYDVPNSAYYYEAVKWAVEQGVTTGIGNNLFGPDQPCTRAQIVTFLWRAAGSPEPKAANSFSDVSADSYYAKAVAWAIENGVTTGVGGDHFAPDDACTRAQAVTLLARALSARAEGKAAFSDVPADSYYADAVAWAAASGITEGIGGGLFGPSNDCTRAQIVTFLYRAYSK